MMVLKLKKLPIQAVMLVVSLSSVLCNGAHVSGVEQFQCYEQLLLHSRDIYDENKIMSYTYAKDNVAIICDSNNVIIPIQSQIINIDLAKKIGNLQDWKCHFVTPLILMYVLWNSEYKSCDKEDVARLLNVRSDDWKITCKDYVSVIEQELQSKMLNVLSLVKTVFKNFVGKNVTLREQRAACALKNMISVNNVKSAMNNVKDFLLRLILYTDLVPCSTNKTKCRIKNYYVHTNENNTEIIDRIYDIIEKINKIKYEMNETRYCYIDCEITSDEYRTILDMNETQVKKWFNKEKGLNVKEYNLNHQNIKQNIENACRIIVDVAHLVRGTVFNNMGHIENVNNNYYVDQCLGDITHTEQVCTVLKEALKMKIKAKLSAKAPCSKCSIYMRYAYTELNDVLIVAYNSGFDENIFKSYHNNISIVKFDRNKYREDGGYKVLQHTVGGLRSTMLFAVLNEGETEAFKKQVYLSSENGKCKWNVTTSQFLILESSANFLQGTVNKDIVLDDSQEDDIETEHESGARTLIESIKANNQVIKSQIENNNAKIQAWFNERCNIA